MQKFIALQLGARRAYAVPSILEKAGILETFYTDLCGNKGLLGSFLGTLPPFLVKGQLKNLYGRQLPPNLIDKTVAFPYLTLQYEIDKKIPQSRENKLRALGRFADKMGNRIISRGFGDATHYFSMFGECTPALRYAKKQGLVTVTDIFILLNAEYLVAKERIKYPDLEKEPDQKLLKEAFTWLEEVCDLSDWLIVPSEAVKQDLITNWRVKEERCIVIPYGVNESWLETNNTPVTGRILMVGSANLRKGIHILGQTANKLSYRDYDFLVAGDVTEAIKNSPITKSLNFLGRIPRLDIAEQYKKADIFVLPTFAEGSAGVTYEALACGIPVITTKAAGSVVRDGIDGFIVPEGDADALADKVQTLIENRELRDKMAISARERAKDYTWDKYGDRLLSFFQSI
ncbi:MAG: glycosyltransferase family 4 protein [Cyanobacterium sp.]